MWRDDQINTTALQAYKHFSTLFLRYVIVRIISNLSLASFVRFFFFYLVFKLLSSNWINQFVYCIFFMYIFPRKSNIKG